MYPQLAQLCMIPKAPALAGPLYALFSNSWFCIKNSWENACNSLRGLGIRENDGPTARMRVDRKLVGPRLSVSVFRSQAVASVPTPCGPNRTSLHMRIRHPTPTAPTLYLHLVWIVRAPCGGCLASGSFCAPCSQMSARPAGLDRHEDTYRRHRRFWCAQPDHAIHRPCSHRMPLTLRYTISNAVAGGAFIGTLATHALGLAPALEESFVAAEKMEPAFKVCAPCSLAAQSPAISALYPPAPPSNLMLLATPSLTLAHTHTHGCPYSHSSDATVCCLVGRAEREGQDDGGEV